MRLGTLGTCLAALLLCAAPAGALETDQFSVPDHPLADLGPDLDLKIDVTLRMLAEAANGQLARGGKGGGAAADVLDNDFFARGLADEYDHGVPECTIESWARRTDLGSPDPRFEVGIASSVYGHALIGRPLTLITLAPTINLYGHYCGTDKVGHCFQQGYEYYQTFRDGVRAGKSEADAIRDAVLKGVAQEQGIYGMFIVDVYSNADLAANVAGLTFYRNLTRAVTLPDGTRLPALLVLRNGRWELNAYAGDHHLRPFVSDHWDESMNPCLYAPMLQHIVAANVRDHGGAWVAFHHATRDGEARRLAQMDRWHGIPYGRSEGKDLVTIVNHYFDLRTPRTAVAVKH